MIKFLTAFALISAMAQTAWAAAAEQHWQAMPLLVGVLVLAVLHVQRSRRLRQAVLPSRFTPREIG